jgi:hypothetical protein
MMNRLRTVFVSVTAVAVAMMVLGSNARARSVATASRHPTASQQNYASFLLRLPDARTGMSLMQRLMTQETTRNILKHIPFPSPRQIQRIATLYNQEMSVFSKLQTNISALVADGHMLSQQYVALEAQKEALISQGRILAAKRVGMKAGQVANELYGLPVLISTERGIATPVR